MSTIISDDGFGGYDVFEVTNDSREWIDVYETIEDAKEDYPEAEYIGNA